MNTLGLHNFEEQKWLRHTGQERLSKKLTFTMHFTGSEALFPFTMSRLILSLT